MLVPERFASRARGIKPIGLGAGAPRRSVWPIDFDDLPQLPARLADHVVPPDRVPEARPTAGGEAVRPGLTENGDLSSPVFLTGGQ